jgi:hypothetical protein
MKGIKVPLWTACNLLMPFDHMYLYLCSQYEDHTTVSHVLIMKVMYVKWEIYLIKIISLHCRYHALLRHNFFFICLLHA